MPTLFVLEILDAPCCYVVAELEIVVSVLVGSQWFLLLVCILDFFALALNDQVYSNFFNVCLIWYLTQIVLHVLSCCFEERETWFFWAKCNEMNTVVMWLVFNHIFLGTRGNTIWHSNTFCINVYVRVCNGVLKMRRK